jgi:hypothetical protein
VGFQHEVIVMRMTRNRLGAAALMIAQFAAGQETESAESSPSPEGTAIEFTFTPGVWLPRLGGNARLGSTWFARSIDLDEELELDGFEAVPRGELMLRADDFWQWRLSGFDFSTDADGTFRSYGQFGDVMLWPGDRYRASVDMTSVALEMGADIFTVVDAAADDETRGEVDFRFTPRVGLRYVRVEQTLEAVGWGREDLTGDWVAIFGGLEMRLRYEPEGGLGGLAIGRALQLEAGGVIGPAFGGDGGFLWAIRAGATVEFTPNVGFMFGYRLLELQVEEGDWEFNAGLQGLFLAATIRF